MIPHKAQDSQNKILSLDKYKTLNDICTDLCQFSQLVLLIRRLLLVGINSVLVFCGGNTENMKAITGSQVK